MVRDPSRASCTGCRSRRRRCDRKKPMCTSCEKLNLPPELCVYHATVSIKDKRSDETLEIMRTTNRELMRQAYEAKHAWEYTMKLKIGKVDQYAKAPIINNAIDKNDYLLRDNFETSGRTGYVGRVGWSGIAQTNKVGFDFTHRFRSIVEEQKKKYDKTKQELELELTKQKEFNDIKHSITETLLGIKPIDYQNFHDLLNLILNSLPSYDIIKITTAKFFQNETSRFIKLDEQDFTTKVQTYFKENKSNGSIQLRFQVSNEMIFDILGILSLMLTVIAYPLMSQQLTKNNSTNKKEFFYNFILFINYAEFLNNISFSFLNFQHSSIDYFYSNLFLRYFYEFLPYGERDGTDGTVLRRSIGFSYSTFTQKFNRDSLLNFNLLPNTVKTGFEFILSGDILESFETGTPPVINIDEIHYNYVNELTPEVSNSIIMLNRILIKYYDHESILLPQEYVSFVEDDIIFELQNLIYINFEDVEILIKQLRNFNVEENLKTTYNLSLLIYKIAIVLLCYTMIHSFYETSSRKIIDFKSFFDPNLVDEKIKRFRTLSMKYGMLINFLCVEILKAFQNVLKHPDSLSLYPIEPYLFLYTFITTSIRRTGTAFKLLVVESEKLDLKLLNSFIEREGYDYRNPQVDHKRLVPLIPRCFTIKELKDRKIDSKTTELISKFSKKLLNGKVIMLFVYKFIIEYDGALKNDKLDLNFLKDNYNFFQIVLTTYFGLNTMLILKDNSSADNSRKSSVVSTDSTISNKVDDDEKLLKKINRIGITKLINMDNEPPFTPMDKLQNGTYKYDSEPKWNKNSFTYDYYTNIKIPPPPPAAQMAIPTPIISQPIPTSQPHGNGTSTTRMKNDFLFDEEISDVTSSDISNINEKLYELTDQHNFNFNLNQIFATKNEINLEEDFTRVVFDNEPNFLANFEDTSTSNSFETFYKNFLEKNFKSSDDGSSKSSLVNEV